MDRRNGEIKIKKWSSSVHNLLFGENIRPFVFSTEKVYHQLTQNIQSNYSQKKCLWPRKK
jgi:hypothetical protein